MMRILPGIYGLLSRIRGDFEGSCPQGLKPRFILRHLMYVLKPVPFNLIHWPSLRVLFYRKLTSSALRTMIAGMKIMEGLSDSRGVFHWFVATMMAVVTTFVLV